jgi:hypothetical protein
MKKRLLITLFLGAIVLLALKNSGDNPWPHKNAGSPPSGHAGDPAGGNRNCSACHSGNDVTTQPDWITSNIPAQGYIPGTTYTITATATGASVTRFGFQVSPQKTDGTFMGTLINTSTETQLSGNNRYINQTSSGTSGSGSKSWTFDWTAPVAGSGNVVFYGAFNLTNSNGNVSGDLIRLSTLSVNENVSTSIQDTEVAGELRLFPNPAKDFIKVFDKGIKQPSNFKVFDISGSVVLEGELTSSETTIDISELTSGVYFLHSGNTATKAVKFVKK